MIARDQRLDSFTRSYIETALWSSMDNANDQGGEPLDENYSAADIDPHTMAQMIADCTAFQERNAELLSDSGLSDKRAGHYFWLSRNGHGSGFFDENLDALQDAAEAYGEFDLYVGDDGVIYAMGYEPPSSGKADVNEARRGRRAREARRGNRRVAPTTWTRQNTTIETWFERDRSHVELRTLDGTTIIEWWDEAVEDAVMDGFLDSRDWHGSAVEYANYIGAQPARAGAREASPAGARAGEARPRPSPASRHNPNALCPTCGIEAGRETECPDECHVFHRKWRDKYGTPDKIRPPSTREAPAPTRSAHHAPSKKRSR
jgi:hypothetical protein